MQTRYGLLRGLVIVIGKQLPGNAIDSQRSLCCEAKIAKLVLITSKWECRLCYCKKDLQPVCGVDLSDIAPGCPFTESNREVLGRHLMKITV